MRSSLGWSMSSLACLLYTSGSGLVGQVDRVFEGNVPDGERFKLGVTGLDASLVLVVQLGQTGGHFAAAGAGGRDDHQRALGLDVLVLAVALVADDAGHIVGVAGDLVVAERPDAQPVDCLLYTSTKGAPVSESLATPSTR